MMKLQTSNIIRRQNTRVNEIG